MKLKRMVGTGSSPVSPKMMASGRRFNDVQWDGSSTLVWSETRGGQGVLVAQEGIDAPHDLTEPGMSVRGRVGYGGGEFRTHKGVVVFSAEGRLYRQSLTGGRPRPITPAFGAAASPVFSPDGKWIVYVLSYEDVDGLALVDSAGETFPRKLAYGTDFVMQPVWSPDGQKIAYIAWNHPTMPFNGSMLQLAHLDWDQAGVPHAAMIETITGSDTVSVSQPEFAPDGKRLAYISDATGWNQLYLYDLASGKHQQITDAAVDHGTPGWVQGLRTYAWSHDGQSIFYRRSENAASSLWRCDVRSARSESVRGTEHYTHFDQISVSGHGYIAAIASSSTLSPRVISVMASSGIIPQTPDEDESEMFVLLGDAEADERIHARSSGENLSGLATAQAMTFRADDGESIYGLYYPPTSDRFEDTSSAPPLIVHVHGGPTSQAELGFSLAAQFFATRGFAFLAVNHRGSTGYGRAYMDKLRGAWGVYDVEDSACAATRLVEQGLADPRRLVIMGTSAGGFSVLYSLVKKPGFYRAGIAGYPVADQFTTALETHKFEAHYNDYLFGTLPEAADLYRERSPLYHADKISDPLLLFHGDQDAAVPISQSENIVKVLRDRGVPHEYHVYAGEGHGWRKPENIEDYYTKIMDFLKRVVVFA